MRQSLLTLDPPATSTRHVVELRDVVMRFGYKDVSVTFALLAAAMTAFFSAAWLFTPLDLDPHSATTKMVFVFTPLFPLGVAIITSGVAWLVARVPRRSDAQQKMVRE